MAGTTQRKRKLNKTEKDEVKRLRMFDTFMKVMTFLIVIHGLVSISLSYILAFQDKMTIAEELSRTVVTEIIAPFTVYGITKTIENVSKYNKWVEMIFKKEENNDEC